MVRTALWVLAGLVLGGIIHIIVILAMPALAPSQAWDRLMALGADKGVIVLPQVKANEDNPLRLDPELAYAACRIDLSKGPGTMTGSLPQAFWSVAVYTEAGNVAYATTNRDGVGNALDLGIFNAAQTRLLAEQKLDVDDGLLIVEADADQVMVVIRLAPPMPENRSRYEKALAALKCGNLSLDAAAGPPSLGAPAPPPSVTP